METESHAVTHVKNEGAGAICCARGPGSFVWSWLVVFVQSYPLFIFDIGPFTLHYILAN